MKKNNSKILNLTLGTLAVIVPIVYSMFELQIKNAFGLQPKAFWQSTMIDGKFKDQKTYTYKAVVYNQSDSAGEIVATINGKYKIEDFSIKGSKAMPTIESDLQNTYIKIDPIYPKEIVDIRLYSSSSESSHFDVGSKNLKLEEVYTLPYIKLFEKSNAITYLLIFYLIVLLVYFAYDRGKVDVINRLKSKMNESKK